MRKFLIAFFVISFVCILIDTTIVHGKKIIQHKKHPNSKTILKPNVIESLKKLKFYLQGFHNISDDPFQNTTNPVDANSIFSNEIYKTKLLNTILQWLGTPYKMGGSTKKGIDCSNFVAQILRQTFGINFPANAQTQSRLFNPINDLKELSFGDLIFFSGRNKKSKRIGHVGIYLGNGVFAHSSTGKGVIITHISEGYYGERFRFGGKLSLDVFNIVYK
ncbi:MAG: C40 family peptidase [Candidatus Kapaibacteriota bacterium]